MMMLNIMNCARCLVPLTLLLLLLATRCLSVAIPDYSQLSKAFNEGSEDDDVQDDEDEKFLIKTEACYGDLGCFSIGGKFFSLINRPVVLVPESPESIGTEFLLFTRDNPANAATLVYNDVDSVLRSKFKTSRPTKLLIHGYLENGLRGWMNRIRQAMLKRVDCNVIQVGWFRGALTAYNQATSNTRVVGAVVARMLVWLESRFGLKRDDVHIIGFSLGAHVAGYAGERMGVSGQPISRITGLDPAGPYFEGTDPIVRLDPTDAQFVDSVHTDAGYFAVGTPVLSGGFGTKTPVGHVDFFVNGGHHQPGCLPLTPCDHSRAPELFIATLEQIANPTAFAAFPCESYDKFLAGGCGSRCPADGCPSMGYLADNQRTKFSNRSPPNRHFLLTGSASPYFLLHYHVTLRLSPDSASGRIGKLRVRLSRGARTCGPHELLGQRELEPRSDQLGVFGCDWAASESAPALQVTWIDESLFGNVFTYRIVMESATLTEMAIGKEHKYCRFGGAFASAAWVHGQSC